MVKIKRGFWFFLLALLAYLSSPGYPATKTEIHNLPVNQDMGVLSQSYPKEAGGEKKYLTVNACEACEDELNDAAKCRRCVALRADCADCCLTENSNDEKVVRCTKEDNDNDYDCTALFYDDDCEQVECGDTCFNACNDYSYSQFSDDDIETPNACYGTTGTGGTPKNTTPKGWQRRGCPEENDDELAPDGSCSLLPGTGLDRKWKCSSGELEPQFSGCDLMQTQDLRSPPLIMWLLRRFRIAPLLVKHRLAVCLVARLRGVRCMEPALLLVLLPVLLPALLPVFQEIVMKPNRRAAQIVRQAVTPRVLVRRAVE